MNGGEEQVVLDCNKEVEGHSFFALHHLKISQDGKKVAYTIDLDGTESYHLYVRDIQSQEKRNFSSLGAVLSVEWDASGKHLFYSCTDEMKRPWRLYRICVEDGEEGRAELIFEEKDGAFLVDVGRTKDGKLLLLSSTSKTSSEIRYIRSEEPLSTPKLLLEREKDLQYFVEHNKGKLFFVMSRGGVRSVTCSPLEDPKEMKMVRQADAESCIEEGDLLEDYMITYERKESFPFINLIDLKSSAKKQVELEDKICSVSPCMNNEMKSSTFLFQTSSPLIPQKTWKASCEDGSTKLLREVELAVNFPFSEYMIERMMVKSHDQVEVPLTVVRSKKQKRDANSPFLMEAYGAYGINIEPQFEVEKLPLLARGWVNKNTLTVEKSLNSLCFLKK